MENPLSLRSLLTIPVPVAVFGIGGVFVAAAAIVSFATGADFVLLKVGEESNVPTWYSSSQLFAVGLVLSTLTYRDLDVRRLRSIGLIGAPALFFFLSLDEIAMLHERLGDWLQAYGVGTGLRTSSWMVAFVPIVIVFVGIALWGMRPYLQGRSEAWGLALAGAAVLGFAAVGIEFAANFVPEGSSWQQGLGFAEEYGEMVGGTLLLWSALVILRLEGFRLDFGRKANGSDSAASQPSSTRKAFTISHCKTVRSAAVLITVTGGVEQPAPTAPTPPTPPLAISRRVVDRTFSGIATSFG